MYVQQELNRIGNAQMDDFKIPFEIIELFQQELIFYYIYSRISGSVVNSQFGYLFFLKYLTGHGFRDFTIAVGNTFDSNNIANFDPTTYTTCVSVTGIPPKGDVLDVICDPPLEGRYLTVYMTGVEFGELQICEIMVYDHPGEYIQYKLIAVNS